MTEPNRTSTGIAYLTFDATLNTDASMIIQQKLDLSGNTTAQTFCENAFDLAAGEDISGALLTDSGITDYYSNHLVYLGSNDVNVQKTFLNNKLNSSIAQNIACNAYEMTLGKNNQIPLVSNLGERPPVVEHIYSNGISFVAVKTDGTVIEWGYGSGYTSNYNDIYTDGVSIVVPNHNAYAAVKLDGSLISWGPSSFGGGSHPSVTGVSAIVAPTYSASVGAFAVLKTDGSVVTWGYAPYGGDTSHATYGISSGSVTSDVSMIYCTISGAFAALKTDGSVVTWGLFKATDVSNLTSGVSMIYTNKYALAALKTDGSVVTWGRSGDYGADSSSVSSSLSSNVSVIYSTDLAFAALKTDGSVVTWGSSSNGGDSSSVSSLLSSGVSVIYSTDRAFAALKTDGSVVTWGNSDYGGDSSSVSSSLSSGVSVIYSNTRAFAALKTDGSVVTWGASTAGGNSYVNDGAPSNNNIINVSSSLSSGVVAVYSNPFCFAAVKTDGSVVTWGWGPFGGNLGKIYDYVNSALIEVSDVSSDLTSGVSKIFSTNNAFAALKNDGSIVTWGYDERGGDSSSVANQLNP